LSRLDDKRKERDSVKRDHRLNPANVDEQGW